jgi:sulfur-oxidizing protein SoxX
MRPPLLALFLLWSSVCWAEEALTSGDPLSQSLTGRPGDPARGREIARSRDLGNCVLCHKLPLEETFFGNVGPDLSLVGDRLTEKELRLRVVDSARINPDTIMPSYYRTEGLRRVAPAYRGKPVLTAEQVEDVIAFLMTLRGKRSRDEPSQER